MSPRQQARRAGPTVIFPTGHDDRPRLWPALSLAAGVCVALLVLSVRWSTGGLAARPPRAPAALPDPSPPPAMVFTDDHPVAAAPQRPARPAVRPVRREGEDADAQRAAIGTEAAASQTSTSPPAAAAPAPAALALTPAAPAAPPPPPPPPASAPVAAQDPPPVASLPPARLFVSSQPWGRLYVDGQFVGNTPRLNLPVSPGRRRIRISRDGYASFDTTIAAMPETVMRLTGINLREVSP